MNQASSKRVTIYRHRCQTAAIKKGPGKHRAVRVRYVHDEMSTTLWQFINTPPKIEWHNHNLQEKE